jgi:hypothetical protein
VQTFPFNCFALQAINQQVGKAVLLQVVFVKQMVSFKSMSCKRQRVMQPKGYNPIALWGKAYAPLSICRLKFLADYFIYFKQI